MSRTVLDNVRSRLRLDSVRARLAVVVLAAAVIVAGAALVSHLQIRAGPSAGPATYPEYETSRIVPDRVEADGLPEVERAGDPGLVLIDKTHSNRFTGEEIQPLVSALSAAGYRVEFLTLADDFDRALSRADAFVVIDPGTRYSQFEVDRIESFVETGGRLLLMGEPVRSQVSLLAIVPKRSRMAPLSARFGIEFGTGYLFNMDPSKRDGNFQNVFVKAQTGSDLAAGIDTAVLYTATHVDAVGGTPVFVAAKGTRNVRGDNAARYTVAVRKGNVFAIGDTTFLERGNYDVKDNERLIANIVTFLTGGERERTLLDFPYIVDRNATIQYTSPRLLEAAKRLGDALGRPGSQPTLSLENATITTDRTDVLVTTFDHLRAHPLPGSDITLSEKRIRLPSYRSRTRGIIVIRQVGTSGDVDLLIAADTIKRVERGVEILTSGGIDQAAISDSTAVIRTDAAFTPTPTPTPSPDRTATNVTES